MSELLRALLLAVAGVLGPVLFSFLSGLAPGFPLPEGSMTALLVWVVGAILGGAGAGRLGTMLRYEIQVQHRNTARKLIAQYTPIAALTIVFLFLMYGLS